MSTENSSYAQKLLASIIDSGGRFGWSIFWCVAVVAFGLAILSVGSHKDSKAALPEAPVAVAPLSPEEGERNAETAKCNKERPAELASYSELVKKGKPLEAASAVRVCAKVLDDAEMKAMAESAERKSYLDTIKSAKASKTDKLEAMKRFVQVDPAAGHEYESKIPVLQAQVDKALAVVAAREARHRGVQLGMSQDEVLGSSWGRPNSVNRTTDSGGVHEQWVYDGGYLYFENAVLTSIQN